MPRLGEDLRTNQKRMLELNTSKAAQGRRIPRRFARNEKPAPSLHQKGAAPRMNLATSGH
jgi:hypothetical protein